MGAEYGMNGTCAEAKSGLAVTTIVDIPLDVLRLVFEAAVSLDLDDNARQHAGYTLALAAKFVNSWIEPLLYSRVVLRDFQKAEKYGNCLQSKPQSFLAKAVKSVWLLSDIPFAVAERLLVVCVGIEQLVCYRTSLKVLDSLEAAHGAAHALRELALISPDDFVYIPPKRIAQIHLIDPSGAFLLCLGQYLDLDNEEAGFNDIDRLCIDFTSTPTTRDARVIRFYLMYSNYIRPRTWLKASLIEESNDDETKTSSWKSWLEEVKAGNWSDVRPENTLTVTMQTHSPDEAQRLRNLIPVERAVEAFKYNQRHWDEIHKYAPIRT